MRRGRQRACVRLLQDLTPHLQAARIVETELDRRLARRFNAFRYLRDDELGLSRIIADLLDPVGEHGQETIFLEEILKLLKVSPEVSDSVRSIAGDIRVVRERGLPGGRRIDITVDIPTKNRRFCLAFENKPYAGDQYGQCRDYLEFLNKEYGERFLLVYLPPRFQMPDESSLPPVDRERWKNHFRVLPYVADDAPPGDGYSSAGDGAAPSQPAPGEEDAVEGGGMDDTGTAVQYDAAVGDGASLANWFGTCYKLSEAERLRWFLRDAQRFCQQTFGDSIMPDTETRYIHKHLLENPKHLRAAFAVARTWPSVRTDVCHRFLDHLRDKVEERLKSLSPAIGDDIQVRHHYGGEKRYSNYLWITRYSWTQYDTSRNDDRTVIRIENCEVGPTSWNWGVRSPKPSHQMTDEETKHREQIEVALRKSGLALAHTSVWWPQWEWPQRYLDWDPLVPDLHEECAAGGGPITTYYVDGLLKIAERAIPAISSVEGT